VFGAVVRHVDWSIVKCLVIAGPGFAKDTFKSYLEAEAVRRDVRPLIENKASIITAQVRDVIGLLQLLRIQAELADLRGCDGRCVFAAGGNRSCCLSQQLQVLLADSWCELQHVSLTVACLCCCCCGCWLQASSAYKHSLKEVLALPAIAGKIKDTKAAREVAALQVGALHILSSCCVSGAGVLTAGLMACFGFYTTWLSACLVPA
jgi:hypothetical protein